MESKTWSFPVYRADYRNAQTFVVNSGDWKRMCLCQKG